MLTRRRGRVTFSARACARSVGTDRRTSACLRGRVRTTAPHGRPRAALPSRGLKLKELVETGELGRVFYLYGNRQNLGKVRRDENALWSLAPHNISVLFYLLDDRPTEVSARGDSYLRTGIADVVFCYLRFESSISAHLHLSWLDPQKLRRLTVVGSERMAVFDDMETDRKLMVYEKAAVPGRTGAYGEYIQARSGDIFCPWTPPAEPLRLECEQFIAAVALGGDLTFGTPAAVDVVEVLEALQRSLDLGGAAVTLRPARPRIFRCFPPLRSFPPPVKRWGS